MSDIPIFDSLTHPTLDGNWILPRYPNVSNIRELKQQMKKSNTLWSFAVGMKDIGGYRQDDFIRFVESYSDSDSILFPIAYFNPEDKTLNHLKDELKTIKQSGFVGIKLHPRISNFQFSNHIADIIKEANLVGLSVLLCTYCYGQGNASKNTPVIMMEMLQQCSGAKVILLHAGSVRLLEYMEIARAFPNVLLDLSLTLCKYEGSSLDLDISFMFKNFDRRICVGSDFPEFSLMKLRERFEYFSEGLDRFKIENIAHRNTLSFLEKVI